MVAVVDGEVGRTVVIRAAPAADLLGCLMHPHDEAGIGQSHAGRQAGDAGPENVNRPRHQITA